MPKCLPTPIVLFALLCAACSAEVSERQIIRPIPGGTLTQEAVAKAAPAYAVSRHSIAAADGVRLHAVLLRQPGAKGILLYFGGNGYTIERFGAMTAAFYAPLGVDLMLVDHRGYGLSEGSPTAAALEADGLAAFDYLASMPGGDPGRVIVHGQSLGSFIAGHVAAHRQTGGVVLESSVTTTEDWVKAQMGGATRAVVKVKVAGGLKGRGNLANMAAIDEPLLLLVGSADRTTPPRLSQALYDASPLPAARKTLVVVETAGHNDVLTKPDALAAYRRFLEAGLR
jgi:fermentation-respiration switch protein FrsA (DUF1100 family)